jgi:hypothetical protein
MLNSFTIQLRACPRCGILRTGHRIYSTLSFCFNCQLLWEPSEEPGPRIAEQIASYAFCAEELVRLQAYRAAVRMGFFTDWPAEPGKLTNQARDASSECD